MGLGNQIRSERAQKRIKQPFQRGLFERVSGLVKAYGLGDPFLTSLDHAEDHVLTGRARGDGVKTKGAFEPPLFSLCTEEEYRVTVEIMTKVSNPYLNFANSPDEILVSGQLFGLNPSLEPDALTRYHFETLVLAELAERELRNLVERVQLLRAEKGFPGQESAELASLQERIGDLRGFLGRMRGTDSA